MPMEEFLDEMELSCPNTREYVADAFNCLSVDLNVDLVDFDQRFPGFYSHFFKANYSDVKILKGSTVAFS